tara:strand:+ start:12 stop:644 length:633 start_codon:yes stop_codon:yes gene_type:complete
MKLKKENYQMDYKQAIKLFGKNIIGPNEFKSFPISFKFQNTISEIDINIDNLDCSKYILIFGPNLMSDGSRLNINKMLSIFGKKASKDQIAFYNQDWYLSEEFANNGLEDKWYLVQKEIVNDSRGLTPPYKFQDDLPSAILCTFLFFSWWLKTKEILWEHDYVWCSDLDNQGDQIYIGKYRDLNNHERSGYSIHRHLSIKKNYGCIRSFC